MKEIKPEPITVRSTLGQPRLPVLRQLLDELRMSYEQFATEFRVNLVALQEITDLAWKTILVVAQENGLGYALRA